MASGPALKMAHSPAEQQGTGLLPCVLLLRPTWLQGMVVFKTQWRVEQMLNVFGDFSAGVRLRTGQCWTGPHWDINSGI